jgi:hypothetical protein
MTQSNHEDDRWSDPEPAISVSLVHYTLQLTTPAACAYRREPLALIGIHALARRYQRGIDNTDLAIIADISALEMHVPRLISADNPINADDPAFSLSCASGVWVGAVETVRMSEGPDQRLLYVRSFLPLP